MKLSVALFLLLAVLCDSALLTHSYGSYNPGEIYPATVEIAVGESINITCRMNPIVFPRRNASDLHFIKAYSNEPVPAKDVAIVNATTVVFMLLHAVEQQNIYLCKCGLDAIMDVKVYVGSIPRAVNDFKCRNYDFDYILCNFTQPENPVLTQYNLSYSLHSPMYLYYPVCNYDDKPKVVCNSTLVDKPRSHLERFPLTFNLRAVNTLGVQQESYNIYVMNITVPQVVGEITSVNISTDALELAWRIPKYEQYRARGLKWEVLLQPYEMLPIDLSGHTPVWRRGEFLLRLTELPYAYCKYELRIRARVTGESAAFDANHSMAKNNAQINDELWSTPFVYSFNTTARRPDRPPRTDVGSFYIDSTETKVRLYWEQLLPYEYNGDNFHYTISEVRQNDEKISLAPLDLAQNSALFRWQKGKNYTFEIRSANHLGVSDSASRLEIPALDLNGVVGVARNLRAYTPPAIHNVYHAANNSYTLTWEVPAQQEGLQDYTVYWCNSKRALQNECQGSLHFRRVPRNTRKFITQPWQEALQQEHTLNLAVSANYIHFNTGMHWTPCTMDVNSELVKMEPEVQAISSSTIKVQWSLERICLSILMGYNLTYCELSAVPDNIPPSCLPETQQTIVLGKVAKKYELLNLKPFTKYHLQMLMYSSMKVGKVSEPVTVQTFEAAPSPPRLVQVNHVSKHNATISWLPPSETNGHIRHYVLNFNDKQLHLDVDGLQIASDGRRLMYELSNLTSFNMYSVNLQAYTSAGGSGPSQEVHFTTLIGVPSMPGTASIRDHDSLIEWSRPSTPAGRLEFYELAVIELRNDMELHQHISIVMGDTSCRLHMPNCVNREQKFVFKVRAVNAALLSHEVAADDVETHPAENAHVENLYHQANNDPHRYKASDHVTCTGSQQQAQLSDYLNSNLYHLYKSHWRQGDTYSCSLNAFNKSIVFIVLGTFLVAFMIMTASYMARKKIMKMSEIECTLPPGLNIKDGVPHSGVDGFMLMVDSEHKAFASAAYESQLHQQEQLPQHTEKHHLLDLGYLGSNHTLQSTQIGSGNGVVNCYMRNSSECMSADSLGGSQGSMSTEHEMDRWHNLYNSHGAIPHSVDDEAYIAAVATPLPATTRKPQTPSYVNPPKILNWQVAPIQRSTTGGYVAVNSLNDPSPLLLSHATGGGYVPPSQVQHLISSSNTPAQNGYTTLQQWNSKASNQTGVAANPAISGYVTQRDLNSFGQNTQHN